jgi:hypothetical protein
MIENGEIILRKHNAEMYLDYVKDKELLSFPIQI